MTEPSPIPAFTLVPRRHDRHDGWTPARQRGFIAALADTGCVSRAARAVGKSPEGAYALRRAPGAEGFRAAWSAALANGVQRLADIAFERAIDGVPIPIFHQGQQVGERRAYNDRLLMFTLRHHDPEQYGAARGNAISPATHARLKREWLAERDAAGVALRERRARKMIRDDLVCATALSDKLALMNERLTRRRARRRPDGEYDCAFRRELDAFDRLYPDVRDWTDEDVAAHTGWPAAAYLTRRPDDPPPAADPRDDPPDPDLPEDDTPLPDPWSDPHAPDPPD